MENLGTIWVCECCIGHHCNGDCVDCYYGDDEDGHDKPPLSHLGDNEHVTAGMFAEEHGCSDYEPLQERDHDCDCEYKSFSASQCEGCGSYLHGVRHAMTLWSKDVL